MKLSIKYILLVSAIALASQSPVVLADEAAVTSDADAAKECAADDTTCITPDAEPVAAVAEEPPAAAAAAEEDPKCPSRPHIIRCAAKYLDTNQNGALEKSELETAMNSVSWILRSLLKVIGSVDSIMTKCDADGDGAISIDRDMDATKETCLATCFKRNAFKRLFFPECTE